MYDSYAWYNHMLSDASQMKNMPEVRNKARRPCTAGLLEAWGGGGAFCGDIEACQLLVGGRACRHGVFGVCRLVKKRQLGYLIATQCVLASH